MNIKDKIYEIRGEYVMLDSDLAKIYECKNGTKEINQAVKNNIEKFPERFSWLLSDQENNDLRSKFLTANISNMSRVNPRVFTEQGVWMLSTILKTKVATETTIKIMDAFVLMRKYISTNLIEQKYVNNLVMIHENRISLLESTFHDRYIIIDKNTIYHLGASINHAGSRTFSINILEDEIVKETLINSIGGTYEYKR